MKNVTNVDIMDKDRFQKAEQYVPQPVKDLITSNEAATDLLTDTFGALYKYQPMIQNEVDPDRQLNRQIISEMMGLSEYKQLRNYTVGDIQSAATSVGIVEPIWKALPDSVKDAQRLAENASTDIETALDSENYDPTVLEQLFDQAEQTREKLNDQIEEWQDAIRQAVRKGLAKAEQDSADGEMAMAALGCGSENGVLENSGDVKQRTRIMQALRQNEALKRIIRDAGRMTNIAQKKQREKSIYTRDEVVDLEQGDELSRVLPSEFASLMSPEQSMRTLFYKKYMEASLTQYKLEGHEPKAQGPVIVEIDCSGSMFGEPDEWSKACALTMYSIARKQKRDFSILLFNTQVVKEVYIKKGEHRTDDLINILTAGASGGTSFEEPLSRAIELIRTEGHKKADLIVITDGICDISPEYQTQYNEEKKQLEFSTYAIIIGGGKNEEAIAEKFSDSVTMLQDMIGRNEGSAFNCVFNI
jgi:uncharacterized protein with von Willebrand factor type A (vWA) domain